MSAYRGFFQTGTLSRQRLKRVLQGGISAESLPHLKFCFMYISVDQTGNSFMPLRVKGDKAIAEILGCHFMTIRKLRRAGKIPYFALGRAYFYDVGECYRAFHHEIKSEI